MVAGSPPIPSVAGPGFVEDLRAMMIVPVRAIYASITRTR